LTGPGQVLQELPHIIIVSKRKEQISFVNDQHFQTVLEHDILHQTRREKGIHFLSKEEERRGQSDLCFQMCHCSAGSGHQDVGLAQEEGSADQRVSEH